MTAASAPSPPPRPRPRWRRGLARLRVRTKVVAAVLAVSALGLLAAGLLTHTIQTRVVSERVSAELDQEVAEFRRLASVGVDPETGLPFTGVPELLATAMDRNVPGAYEMFVTFEDDEQVHFTPQSARTIVEDPDVVAAVRDLAPDAPEVVEHEVETEIGRVRLVVVPVRVADGEQSGAYLVASALDQQLATELDVMRTYTIVSVVALVLLGVVAWLVSGRLLLPLRHLTATAARVSETDLHERVPVASEDDVADLARAFNTMLDRLALAIETQRQFLDDAGHELRTPLTVLHGHLEVLDPDDPEDVRDTRALLLDETSRMSRIVEDLVLLANAERSDFVRTEPVDLGRLTDGVHDKARALGERRWLVDARAEATVRADPQRLTQAMLQLADNAVKFTPEGAQVAIGSEVSDGVARLWVRDDGPGVADEDADRIFGRFARGSAAHGVRGSGLGLPIVRAIAQGHGGDVSVARVAPSTGSGRRTGGARFEITWPANSVGPDDKEVA